MQFRIVYGRQHRQVTFFEEPGLLLGDLGQVGHLRHQLRHAVGVGVALAYRVGGCLGLQQGVELALLCQQFGRLEQGLFDAAQLLYHHVRPA